MSGIPPPIDRNFPSAARAITRGALTASLGTLDRNDGSPYVSLIAVAAELDATPLFLISKLAWHTQNLLADGRASLLFAAGGGEGDPLDAGRVSVMGRAEPAPFPSGRERFLARHPEAALYADFADFSFFRLAVQQAHFVAGFGRIRTLQAAELVLPRTHLQPFIEGERQFVARMNEAKSELIQKAAMALSKGAAVPWRLTGCDPEGCDFLSNGRALRLNFARAAADWREAAELIGSGPS